MKLLWILFWISLSCGAGYFGYIILKGWSIIRMAPREPMFICDKGHGPLPKSALINFMGEDYCSICFHQRMKAAEKGL
jgi:hypothetical protein